MAFRNQLNGSTGILAHSISGDRLANGSIGAPQLAAQGVGAAAIVHTPWQAPTTYGTGWAAGPSSGPVEPLQYRTVAPDRLEIVGAFHSTSATPAATCFTLPVGFQPVTTQRVGCVSNSGGTVSARFIEIQAGGVVQIDPNLSGSGQDVYVEVSVPLGLIP